MMTAVQYVEYSTFYHSSAKVHSSWKLKERYFENSGSQQFGRTPPPKLVKGKNESNWSVRRHVYKEIRWKAGRQIFVNSERTASARKKIKPCREGPYEDLGQYGPRLRYVVPTEVQSAWVSADTVVSMPVKSWTIKNISKGNDEAKWEEISNQSKAKA
jgi:hypothetical protein